MTKNNKQLTITDKKGKSFEIKKPWLAIYSSLIRSGYISDTLYVIDMIPKKIMLAFKTIALREVFINSRRETFDPHKEYPEIYTRKSKVYIMSPTTWFSKRG